MAFTIHRLLCLFRSRGDGTILVETAAAIPIVVLLTMGGAEFARYVLLHQKFDRVAATLGDVVAQQEQINEQQMEDIFCSIGDIMQPFEIGGDGVVYVSSVMISPGGNDGDPAEVQWQRTKGTYSASCETGSEGGTATMPFGLKVGETVIVSEMVFAYTPFFFGQIIGASEIRKKAYFRPRLSKLDVIDPPPDTFVPCPT